jgi:hypothetical protein
VHLQDLTLQAVDVQFSVGAHIRLSPEAATTKNVLAVGYEMISVNSMLRLPHTTLSHVGLRCVRLNFLHLNSTLPELHAEFALHLSFGSINECFMGVRFLLQR